MPQESLDPKQLFTVPAEDFAVKYRALTKEELAELGVLSVTTPVPEDIKTSREAFLQNTFETWDKDSAPNAKIKTETRSPADQDWTGLEADIDTDKFGELIINPETQSLNFETTKPFIPDLSSQSGKKLSEVADYLVKTYGDRYYIPGIEYEEWIFRHDLDDFPSGNDFKVLKTELKDNHCSFFGSTLRYSNGHWCVPYLNWNGSSWYRYARWLGHTWDSRCRVVLLER